MQNPEYAELIAVNHIATVHKSIKLFQTSQKKGLCFWVSWLEEPSVSANCSHQWGCMDVVQTARERDAP